MTLTTSAPMRAMIENWEGNELEAYQDMVGVWTIGYGHTGPDVHEGQIITQAEADQLLTNDLHSFEVAVTGLVHGSATSQQQFDAMVSFSYNLGSGALAESEVLSYHLAGNYPAAAADFSHWANAGGHQVQALLNRRNGEAAVYLNGDYT
jgi:lysozyme